MFCETESEAFADPSRELIFQVARGYLERCGIVSAGLVFDPAQHRALLNDGPRFQEILQRIALLQGQHTKRPVSERMKELTALAEAAMRRVETLDGQLPPASAADDRALAAFANQAADGHGADDFVRAGILLTRRLAQCENWTGRAMLCLDLLDAGAAGAAQGLLDQTLAEILRLKPAVTDIYGTSERPAMIDLCLLFAGEAAADHKTDIPLTAVATRLRRRGGIAELPGCLAAMRERLIELLGGMLPIYHDEPHEEWPRMLALKQRIGMIPALQDDWQIASAMARRFARFATPEQLNPLLAREPEFARKILTLLRIYREVEDATARFELLGILGHYLEHRDFRTSFIGKQATREEFATLAADISGALVTTDIPEQRKARFLELFRNHLAAIPQPAAARPRQRGAAGSGDVVVVNGVRIPLRNWSAVGLQFGPCPPGLAVGDRMQLTVEIRNAALTLDFSAEAEVLRVTGDLVAARYRCADEPASRQIRAFFSAG